MSGLDELAATVAEAIQPISFPESRRDARKALRELVAVARDAEHRAAQHSYYREAAEAERDRWQGHYADTETHVTELLAQRDRAVEALREITQAEWGGDRNVETPFQFEQRVHRIAAAALSVPAPIEGRR